MQERLRGNFPQFQQWRDEVDRLVSNFVAHPTVAGATRYVTGRGFPALNLWEDNENLYAECELPGVRSEDLDVSVVGNELSIKGRRTDAGEPQATFHRRERGCGPFARTVQVPSEIDSDRVQANLREGILRITLPKAESAKPRKVQVRTSP